MTQLGQSSVVAAVDVGGTLIKGTVLGPEGSTRLTKRWPTPRHESPAAVVEAALDAAEELLATAPETEAIGMVVPGLVDEDAGVAIYSENIGWHDIPFRSLLEKRTGLPVGFGHDVRAGGLAELTWGAARGAHDLLFMPIGTGISGAMYVQGSLVLNMYAGEIGHISIGSDEPCACGAVGCLEAVASGAAVAKRYNRASGERVDGSKEVLGRAHDGDQTARGIWQEALSALALALTTYISLLAPERIVIGGGVSHAGELLLGPLRERVHERLVWQQEPEIVAAALADDAGSLGAGLLARRALADDTAGGVSTDEQ